MYQTFITFIKENGYQWEITQLADLEKLAHVGYFPFKRPLAEVSTLLFTLVLSNIC